jgi:hypothetical protein
MKSVYRESNLKAIALTLCSCIAGLTATAPAVADASADAALDKLAAAFGGTWKTSGESFKTQYTEGGKDEFTTLRDCWPTRDTLRCVLIKDGKLMAELVFTYNVESGVYDEAEITPNGRTAGFTVTVKDNAWTFRQDVTDNAGNALQYELVRTYTSPTLVEYHSEYTRNGKEWIGMAKGTETKVEAGK